MFWGKNTSNAYKNYATDSNDHLSRVRRLITVVVQTFDDGKNNKYQLTNVSNKKQ